MGGTKLDAIEVMSHVFFANIAWEKLILKKIEPCYEVSRAKIDEIMLEKPAFDND